MDLSPIIFAEALCIVCAGRRDLDRKEMSARAQELNSLAEPYHPKRRDVPKGSS